MIIFTFGMLGYMVHLLGSWAQYCKTQKPVRLWEYIAQDWAGWVSATVGAVVVVALTLDVSALAQSVGLSPKLLATLLGYVGSSILAKLSNTFGLGTGDR